MINVSHRFSKDVKLKYILLFILLYSLMLISCSVKDDYNQIQFSTVYELKADLDSADVPFSSIAYIVEDKTGCTYICDPTEHIVRKFNKEGKEILTFGNHGTGPGEFCWNTDIKINKNKIFVFDCWLNRISIFTIDGQFIKSIKLKNLILSFAVNSNDEIFIEVKDYEQVESRASSFTKILGIGVDGSEEILIDSMFINDIYVAKKESIFYYNFSTRLLWTILPNNNIMTVRSDSYETRIYSSKGKQLSQTFNKGNSEKTTRKDIIQFYSDKIRGGRTAENILESILTLKRKPIVESLWQVDEGVLVRTYNYKENNLIFDKLDLNGELIKSYIIDEKININKIYISDKNLYNYTQGVFDMPNLTKYELNF